MAVACAQVDWQSSPCMQMTLVTTTGHAHVGCEGVCSGTTDHWSLVTGHLVTSLPHTLRYPRDLRQICLHNATSASVSATHLTTQLLFHFIVNSEYS